MYGLAKDNPAMLTILQADNPDTAASDPVETTPALEKAAKRLSNGAVKTRKSRKGDEPVSVTETDSEEETATHVEKQEAKLDEGSENSAGVTSTREVLRFTLFETRVLFYSNWSIC